MSKDPRADHAYDLVYRGELRDSITPGKWIFFQRAVAYGGLWWFGRAYEDAFIFEFDRPVTLGEGLEYIVTYNKVAETAHLFDDDFNLEP